MKKESLFEKRLDDTCQITQMLQKQGKTYAECRAYQHITAILLSIEDNLNRLCILVALLLGFQIGKLISGLL